VVIEDKLKVQRAAVHRENEADAARRYRKKMRPEGNRGTATSESGCKARCSRFASAESRLEERIWRTKLSHNPKRTQSRKRRLIRRKSPSNPSSVRARFYDHYQDKPKSE